MTEREMMSDSLLGQKMMTTAYNTYAGECSGTQLRNVFLSILNEEHEIQHNVFDLMHTKGIYPTPAAEDKKVEETKQQYSQCVK